MSRRVWLLCIVICCLLCPACAKEQAKTEPVSKVPVTQNTLQMEPDFSYVVIPQMPHILIDSYGYQCEDKKVAFFYGCSLTENFEVRDHITGETVYFGTLRPAKEIDGKTLYTGIFTDLQKEGDYYIFQEQVGESNPFRIDELVYNEKYLELEKLLLSQNYEDVSEQAYVLANYMFVQEMFDKTWTDISYIRGRIMRLLNSQDAKTGAFIREMMEEPLDPEMHEGTISLSTTAQMAGVLAQYVYLYRDIDDAAFVNQCLLASQKAYKYVEKYRDNTDTDAWYFAATQLYRTTRQYKYRNAITQYDTFAVESRSSTEQGYTMLADFTYLLTPIGTDYNRCTALLDGYLERAQSISTASSRENFYVAENVDNMPHKEILEDMFVLGVINHVLSGQEYAGTQKNYIHYLSGLNLKQEDYMNENILYEEGSDRINTAFVAKLLVVYGNLYSNTEKENG